MYMYHNTYTLFEICEIHHNFKQQMLGTYSIITHYEGTDYDLIPNMQRPKEATI